MGDRGIGAQILPCWPEAALSASASGVIYGYWLSYPGLLVLFSERFFNITIGAINFFNQRNTDMCYVQNAHRLFEFCRYYLSKKKPHQTECGLLLHWLVTSKLLELATSNSTRIAGN